MENINWNIRNNRSCDQLIVEVSDSNEIIEYQWQLITDRALKLFFPMAIIKREEGLVLSVILGKNNTMEKVDATNAGNPDVGISRIREIAQLVEEAEEYLFTTDQIIFNPNFLRFTRIDSREPGAEFKLQMVVLPILINTNSMDVVINELIPAMSSFYSFSTELETKLKNYYIEGGWKRLQSVARNDMEIDDMSARTEIAGKTESKNKQHKKQSEVKISGKTNTNQIIFTSWLACSILFYIANKAGLLILTENVKLVSTIILILAGLGLTMLTFGSSIISIVRKTAAKFNFVPIRNSQENCTELLNRNTDSYGMAMLSEGLPGTPQENEGRRAFILLDEFIVGRDGARADLCIDSRAVGRLHARISRHEGSYFLTDLGSKNGTRLDGRRINKNEDYLLPDRCRIQFADCIFFFQNEEPL